MLAQVAKKILLLYHRDAQLWICPQDWDPTDFARWNLLASKAGSWIDGTIYGPGMVTPLQTFGNSTSPAIYPVRVYPDITHSLSDQLPIPNWDPVFQVTENREAVNPRVRTETMIAASQKPFATAGFGAYDEGCHDDVNKHVWLAVFWGADTVSASEEEAEAPVDEHALVQSWLREYSRLQFSPQLEPLVLELIYSLEKNWVGAVVGNPQVNATFALATRIMQEMTPRDRWRWRLQQLLYRATYDKFVQLRATIERAGEEKALEALAQHAATSPAKAIAAAKAALDLADAASKGASAELWTELRVWAEAVFQSVHQQFSVPIYGGEYTRRGANLDLARLPLSNAPFLRRSFGNISRLPSVSAQSEQLRALATHADAGPGGFYDDLGELDAPHYVHNASSETGDQALRPTATVSVDGPSDQHYELPPTAASVQCPPGQHCKKPKHNTEAPPTLRSDVTRARLTFVETTKCMPIYKGLPIVMRYPALPAGASYAVSVMFGSAVKAMNLTAGQGGERWLVLKEHSCDDKKKQTFAIPAEVTTKGGELELAFSASSGLSIAEVWIKKTK